MSRAEYLSAIQRFHHRYDAPRLQWLRQPSPYPNVDANLEIAEYFAFVFRWSGKEAAAKRAVAFVDQAHQLTRKRPEKGTFVPAGWNTPLRAHRIWQRLESSAAFSGEVREQLRELMVAAFPRFPMQFHYSGQFGRPLELALYGEILLHYVPGLPDAKVWKPYVETVWTDFRRFDDTSENAGNYNVIFLRDLVYWVNLRGAQEEVFADPDIHRMFERYMLQVLPLGSLPHYGDTMGWNVEWGHWIHLFELAARITGDGRFRWAAQRLFDYGPRHIEDLFSWHYTGVRAMESLMEAYLVADESIVPRAPEQDLVVLSRKSIGERRPGNPPFLLEDGEIPSKVVLRSDATPQSMAMMLDLTPSAAHNPPVPSSLVALVDRGSVLLMDQGYAEKEVSEHNMLWIEDYEGFPIEPDQQRIEVLASEETGPLLYAAVKVEHYAGYPVDLERRVVFARDGAVLVVDDVRFRESFRARLGPVFNLGMLDREMGERWVNGGQGDWVTVRGIGKGTAVVARWKNPARDLLIHFFPVAGGELHVFDRRPDDETSPLPHRVQYRTRVTPRAGETVRFATVLLPHAPLRHPGKLAARVQIEANGAGAVRVPLEEGRSVWLSAGPIASGPFVTDAEATAVVLEGERVVSLGLAGGSLLEIRGQSIVQERTRGNVSR